MENKKKFVSIKDWTTKDYGRNAVIGILASYVLNIDGYILVGVIGDSLGLLGLVCGVIWIYKKINKKSNESVK